MPKEPPKRPKNTTAIAALVRLHESASSEITRYRDIEWQVPSVLVAFLLAFFTGINVKSVSDAIEKNIFLQILLTLNVLSLLAFVVYFVVFVHSAMEKQRNLRSILEAKLKLSKIVKSAGVMQASKLRRIFTIVFFEILIATIITLMILFLVWRSTFIAKGLFANFIF
jgi:hypothetical protein